MRRRALLIMGGMFLLLLVYYGMGIAKPQVTVYKPESCGCCEKYVEYLENSGYEVEVISVPSLKDIYEKHGVQKKLWSCHISYVDDYFVIGHVPEEAIRKLLKEKPKIDGISLPGMPTGSPGMPGKKDKPFRIYSIKGGEVGLFAKI